MNRSCFEMNRADSRQAWVLLLALCGCKSGYVASGASTSAAPSNEPAVSGTGNNVNAPTQWPLLGGSHARSYMDSFCEGRPDSAALPQDPRELIRPGVNAGKAVAF